MSAVDRQAEARRLHAIRGQLASLGAKEWQLVAEGDAMRVDAVGDDGTRVHVITFEGIATPDEMQFCADVVTNVRFLLGLIDRAMGRIRALQPPPAGRGEPKPDEGRPRDFAAEAAMKCSEPAFKTFMEERHRLERPLTDDRTAQRLRSVLGITSRAELNRDERAAAAWRALRDEFKAWRARG